MPRYAISGTLAGLSVSSSVVLLDNGADALPVSANGIFTFPTKLTSGATYAVTMGQQLPGESCTVVSGVGTVGSAPITTIEVQCRPGNDWAWVSGASSLNAKGSYGTLGTPAAGNVPGARVGSSSWSDSTGNLWLFGGNGFDSLGNLANPLNDLWRFSSSTGLWTWISGASTTDANGVYGTLGTPAPGNVPGARSGSSSWSDGAGNLWLFGGSGHDVISMGKLLNDLWKFSPTTGQWTWVSGASTGYSIGIYGTKGTPAPGNVPGARSGSSSWTDGAGNLWLFGGNGIDSLNNPVNLLNDLWCFTPTTGLWTWVSGASIALTKGTYGTRGTPAVGNGPGARSGSSSWSDSAGNFWLFGGSGVDSAGTPGALNDLWMYKPTTGLWTWISGANTPYAKGIYGTLGAPGMGSVPGARAGSSSWSDGAGNLWSFGGIGYDSAGLFGSLNDLWKYNPTSGQWTWVSGATTIDANGSYGALGTPGAANTPGARAGSSSWTDGAGNLWVFGGSVFDSTANPVNPHGNGNDLWTYQP